MPEVLLWHFTLTPYFCSGSYNLRYDGTVENAGLCVTADTAGAGLASRADTGRVAAASRTGIADCLGGGDWRIACFWNVYLHAAGGNQHRTKASGQVASSAGQSATCDTTVIRE